MVVGGWRRTPLNRSYESQHDAIIATAVGINADALRYHSTSATQPASVNDPLCPVRCVLSGKLIAARHHEYPLLPADTLSDFDRDRLLIISIQFNLFQ